MFFVGAGFFGLVLMVIMFIIYSSVAPQNRDSVVSFVPRKRHRLRQGYPRHRRRPTDRWP